MMSSLAPLFGLAVRQVFNNDTSDTQTADAKPQCGGGGLNPDVEFNMGLHVGALFIILVTSTFGKTSLFIQIQIEC